MISDYKHFFVVQQSQSTSSVKDLQQTSPTKESDSKKIDWHLWKTGQIKLEGQGLKQMPDEKDLPEDFQKKLGKYSEIEKPHKLYTNK